MTSVVFTTCDLLVGLTPMGNLQLKLTSVEDSIILRKNYGPTNLPNSIEIILKYECIVKELTKDIRSDPIHPCNGISMV